MLDHFGFRVRDLIPTATTSRQDAEALDHDAGGLISLRQQRFSKSAVAARKWRAPQDARAALHDELVYLASGSGRS
jgi:hypothetical protein